MRRSVSGSFLKSLRKSSFLCLYVGLSTYISEWDVSGGNQHDQLKHKTLRHELLKTPGYLHYTSSAFSETERKRWMRVLIYTLSQQNNQNGHYLLSLKMFWSYCANLAIIRNIYWALNPHIRITSETDILNSINNISQY